MSVTREIIGIDRYLGMSILESRHEKSTISFPPPSGPTSSLNQPTHPDLEHIKARISIREVACALGLSVRGRRMSCWRVENHKNGDGDPSVTFWQKKNRARCWICDSHAWSNIDLVMMVLDCDFPAAVSWMCERFQIPAARPGKHIGHRNGWHPYRAGTNGSLFEWLVRSGLWAELTPTQRSVLPALHAFTDAETGLAEVSYRGLMRYSGVGSPTSVAAAIKHFRRIHLLQVEPQIGSDGFRACNRYRFTFNDPAFLGLLNEIYRDHSEAVQLERSFRAEERKRRRREKVSPLPVKEVTLSNGCSTGKFDSTPRV